MNRQDWDVLKSLYFKPYINQRETAENMGCSLGSVNCSLKKLRSLKYLDEAYSLTKKALREIDANAPRAAVILASQMDLKMALFAADIPKSFLEVHGERLIERLITQLHEAGIDKIYVVVGFLKEKFEYLIDKFDVQLVVNKNYTTRGSLYELQAAIQYIDDAYIVPADIWCADNPFSRIEFYSWYMVSEKESEESIIRCNRKNQLVRDKKTGRGNEPIGVGYIRADMAEVLRERMQNHFGYMERDNNDSWEELLFEKDCMLLKARLVKEKEAERIESYMQLRDLELRLDSVQSEIDNLLKSVFHTQEIKKLGNLKVGESNRSILFSCDGLKYVIRIPNERLEHMLDRRQEAEVYQAIEKMHISDEIVYLNLDNGIRITRYIEDAYACDVENFRDVSCCIELLKNIHSMDIQVDRFIDLFNQINFYEELRGKKPSIFDDYIETKKNVFSLKAFVENNTERKTLTHIDPEPNNFLFTKDQLFLIDWEFAGMQDPHVDIAMFCVYAHYDRERIDQIIDLYFNRSCPLNTKIKIYCYIAICGLMWSNWCEYKRMKGTDFGGYSLQMYRYAKDYYRLASRMIATEGEVPYL